MGIAATENQNSPDDAENCQDPAQADDPEDRRAVGGGAGIVLIAKQEHVVDGRADFPRGRFDETKAHVPSGIFDAIKITGDAAIGGEHHDAAGVREEIRLSAEVVAEIGGAGGGINRILRTREEMPAGFRSGTAKVRDHAFLFLRGHVRRFTRIKTDEDDLIVYAGIEGKHAERSDDALLHLTAKHGAAVIDEGQDNGFLAEIFAELDTAAGFVTERKVKRHLRVELRFESDVLKSRRHRRGRWTDVARDGLRMSGRRCERECCESEDGANFFHLATSFSPSPKQKLPADLFPR